MRVVESAENKLWFDEHPVVFANRFSKLPYTSWDFWYD